LHYCIYLIKFYKYIHKCKNYPRYVKIGNGSTIPKNLLGNSAFCTLGDPASNETSIQQMKISTGSRIQDHSILQPPQKSHLYFYYQLITLLKQRFFFTITIKFKKYKHLNEVVTLHVIIKPSCFHIHKQIPNST